MKFFVENSTLCEAIVTPRRLKMWYDCSRRKKHGVEEAHAAKAADSFAAFAKNIELYLNRESGIFAF